MDLIDFGNHRDPIPKAPCTGDAIPTNPPTGDTMADNPSTADTDDAAIHLPLRPVTPRNTHIPVYTPTTFDFSTLPSNSRVRIFRLRPSISHFWAHLTPASAFPQQYLPDLDSHNWGPDLLDAINNLARLSRLEYKTQAVWW
ncbi:hypothetical protein TUN199_04266 [Pyrenophora tritici-repentis]|uniref:Periplasmic protein TonB n=1 Tax=Pyrenophora tritici-repentis TaxID=45151 RepID=A0A2W1G4V4_9PLEO|nr:hypothetical protein PtrV1_12471 [Pyrenophora tritici-repentis]KAF7445273.1 hypothetical protein A1F99_102590 [Pyrenophora tritici-repentis]KAF7565538.1 Periplasmic protein TonB [Pyrenophora tritici-repentis]KAI0580719.1 hypothetical protein Alg215_05055 [Pyrenophora tritici-repentis]KAI0623718.1 hypothetical protein TUN199_04266 [Pyrenophora tritici-repentis]